MSNGSAPSSKSIEAAIHLEIELGLGDLSIELGAANMPEAAPKSPFLALATRFTRYVVRLFDEFVEEPSNILYNKTGPKTIRYDAMSRF